MRLCIDYEIFEICNDCILTFTMIVRLRNLFTDPRFKAKT